MAIYLNNLTALNYNPKLIQKLYQFKKSDKKSLRAFSTHPLLLARGNLTKCGGECSMMLGKKWKYNEIK